MSLRRVSGESGLPVGDALLVQVHQRAEQLLHDCGGLPLIEVLLVENVVEELAACAVLEHQEADTLPLPHLVQLDNVRMVLLVSGEKICLRAV